MYVPIYAILSYEDLKKNTLNFKQEDKLLPFSFFNDNFARIMKRNNFMYSLWKPTNLAVWLFTGRPKKQLSVVYEIYSKTDMSKHYL